MIPGKFQRFKNWLGFGEKHPPFNLKAQLNKLIFTSEKPLIISEDSATFIMVMATFHQYEKYVSTLYANWF